MAKRKAVYIIIMFRNTLFIQTDEFKKRQSSATTNLK